MLIQPIGIDSKALSALFSFCDVRRNYSLRAEQTYRFHDDNSKRAQMANSRLCFFALLTWQDVLIV